MTLDELLARRAHRLHVKHEIRRLMPSMKELRCELSQGDIAATAAVAQSYIVRLEQGYSDRISSNALERILQVYLELEKQDASLANAGARQESDAANVA